MEIIAQNNMTTSIELSISATISNDLLDQEIYEISQRIINAIMDVKGVGGVGYSDVTVRTTVSNERQIEYDESWG